MASLIDKNFSNESLSLKSLPDFQDVSLEKVQPKLFMKSLISFLITMMTFSSVFLILYFTEVLGFNIAFSIIAGIVLLHLVFVLLSKAYVKRYAYQVREKDIIFKRGLLYGKVTIIPYNRIQHVTIVESFLDKKFNLSQLRIFTAGGSSSDINIPGLEPAVSQKIKATIIGKIQDENLDE
ncbi:PH domain-containing protein [Mesonia sp. K7]|uniref:PH domain-containing protein n=1 Tax=Mesonia sp. K7 TaxID=2218606 RepID=UPI000DA7CD32|nr:PH domain-containing protein [Mesonia sp. K7]PZD78257.1 hypothetical protein DNG35_06040 [Mesonia sp. K7]